MWRYFWDRSASAASCLTLTPLLRIINIIYFFKHIYFIGSIILLLLSVWALTRIYKRYHTRNWYRIFSCSNIFVYLFIMYNRLNWIIQIYWYILHIMITFTGILIFDAMIDMHFVLVDVVAAIRCTLWICLIFILLYRCKQRIFFIIMVILCWLMGIIGWVLWIYILFCLLNILNYACGDWLKWHCSSTIPTL